MSEERFTWLSAMTIFLNKICNVINVKVCCSFYLSIKYVINFK